MGRFFFPCLKEVFHVESDSLPFLRADAVQRRRAEIVLTALTVLEEAGLAAGKDPLDTPFMAGLSGMFPGHPELMQAVHQVSPVRFGKGIAVDFGNEFGFDLPVLVLPHIPGQEIMIIGHFLIAAHILQGLGELDQEIDFALKFTAGQKSRRPVAAHSRTIAFRLGRKEQAAIENPMLLIFQQVLQALPPFCDLALAQLAEGDAVRHTPL